MGVREEAVDHLTAMWSDGGAQVLERAGLVQDWSVLLAHIPEQVLTVPRGPEVAGQVVLGRLRDLFSQGGQHAVAKVFGQALLDVRASLHGYGHAQTLQAMGRLGAVLLRAGDAQAAEPLLHRAWRGLRDVLDEPDLATALVGGDLARAYRTLGEPGRAEVVLADVLRLRRVVTPRNLGLVAAQLAELKMADGRDQEAAPLLQEAWEQLSAQHGEHHRVTLDRARELGALWLRLEQPVRALPVLRSVHDWVLQQGDAEDEAHVGFQLGRALDATGKKEEGLRLMDKSLRWARAWHDEQGLPHPELPQRLATRSRVAEQRGRTDDAMGLLLECVECERQLHGDDSAEVGMRQAAVGDLAARLGRLDEAIGWMDVGLSLLRSVLGDEHHLCVLVAERLIDLMLEKADECIDRQRNAALGWEYISQARGICLDVLGPQHPSHKTLKYYRS